MTHIRNLREAMPDPPRHNRRARQGHLKSSQNANAHFKSSIGWMQHGNFAAVTSPWGTLARKLPAEPIGSQRFNRERENDAASNE